MVALSSAVLKKALLKGSRDVLLWHPNLNVELYTIIHCIFKEALLTYDVLWLKKYCDKNEIFRVSGMGLSTLKSQHVCKCTSAGEILHLLNDCMLCCAILIIFKIFPWALPSAAIPDNTGNRLRRKFIV